MIEEAFENKSIMVIGGAGFIGSHLCDALTKYKVSEIISIDDYSTGCRENHIDGVNYIKASTVDFCFDFSTKIDFVFHLGEYSRVEQSFADYDAVWQKNIIGTKRVIDFCAKSGSKLIYAGSSTKFGDNGQTKMSSPYAWTKYINTELIQNYARWFGIDFAIVYFYNAYGPREIQTGDYATLIAKFSHQYKNGEPLTVVKPGTQRRNFTHVSDIISGLTLVAAAGYGDGYGIGVAQDYSILEVANMFGGPTTYLPERQGNRMSAGVMTQKTRELGWEPVNDLSAYIKRFVEETDAADEKA